MIDLPTAEKIKNSKLALITGLLIGLSLGAGAAWTASTTIHDAQFKVLDAVNDDLRHQVKELTTSRQAKETQIGKLQEQISALSPQRREAESKRRTELQKFIQRIEREIDWGKNQLSRPISWSRECDSGGGNCRTVNSRDRPMSDAEKRLERELDTLVMQRHAARTKLIELLAQ